MLYFYYYYYFSLLRSEPAGHLFAHIMHGHGQAILNGARKHQRATKIGGEKGKHEQNRVNYGHNGTLLQHFKRIIIVMKGSRALKDPKWNLLIERSSVPVPSVQYTFEARMKRTFNAKKRYESESEEKNKRTKEKNGK